MDTGFESHYARFEMAQTRANDLEYDRLHWTWSSPFLLAPRPVANATPEQQDAVRAFFSTPMGDFNLGAVSIPPESPRERLGHLFENTLYALFMSHPKTERVVRSLRFGNTGELDFLIFPKESTHPVLHIEAAIKFYLCLDENGSSSAKRFVGPGLQDSLDRKIDKLYSHQLRLLERPEVIGQIPELWVENRGCVSIPFVKGCLFAPGSLTSSARPRLPSEIETTAATGDWMTPSQFFREWENLPNARFHDLREKRFWVHSGEFAPLIERDALRERLENLIEPQLFAMECDKVYRRIFFVPEDWTHHAHQTRADH